MAAKAKTKAKATKGQARPKVQSPASERGQEGAEVFATDVEAHGYLTAQGWRISMSGLRLHRRQGKLERDAPGSYTRAGLDRYAVTCLKRKSAGLIDGMDGAELEQARQRKKYELDCLKVEKAQAELEAQRAGHLTREEVGRMLVARGALFKNLVFAMIQERVPDWIDLASGDHSRAHELIDRVFEDFQGALAVFATGAAMEVDIDGAPAGAVEVGG